MSSLAAMRETFCNPFISGQTQVELPGGRSRDHVVTARAADEACRESPPSGAGDRRPLARVPAQAPAGGVPR
jgi:hypothetical protein